jgi:hypothetical protein
MTMRVNIFLISILMEEEEDQDLPLMAVCYAILNSRRK